MGKSKNRFFARHAKSSAALVSLGIHALIIVVALSFVAVTVIQKEEQVFEAKPVNRPKMQLKKLQVPVNIKKKKVQKPKLRKRIVVKPKMNQNMPDIKMPEISGVKGGLGGGASGGIGGAGGVGFSMPEMNLFGVKSKGEKVFIVLDGSGHMMVDGIGGIPAYDIIKSELVRILEGLNSAVLFNIAVYGDGGKMLFPNLVPATPANISSVKKWLEPLNAVTKGMGDKDYGPKTLGQGGVGFGEALVVEPLKGRVYDWAVPAMVAMRQQADVVFVLSCRWGHQYYQEATGEKWSEAKRNRWKEYVAKAKAKLGEENDKRREAGQPPRVITHGDRGLVAAYFPGEPHPPHPKFVGYSPREMLEAFTNVRAEHKPQTIPTSSGLGKKKQKDTFGFNVIHFTKANGAAKEERFAKLASLTRGEYRMIEGMESIQSYVSSEETE